MLVVGGTYIERCYEPYWSALYGSRLRAAAVISSLAGTCDYETCIGADYEPQLLLQANSLGVNVTKVHSAPETIQFTYEHPLSKPIITPERADIQQAGTIKAHHTIILRFGMLECATVSTSEIAIYDPQSAFAPALFHANGSNSKRLAVVANGREGFLLTKKHSANEIAVELLKRERAEVVVIKQGPFGCLVATAESAEEIPAFKTDQVFSIGSGDVFAGAFAHYWGGEGLSGPDAAERASRAAALYCGTQQTSVRTPVGDSALIEPLSLDRSKLKTALVYLAGPFFTMTERWIVQQARGALLDMGLRVFSPFHDVGLGIAADVVPEDLEALERSTVVFAILDDMDPGTVFEVGYAVKRGIPVVGFVQNESKEHVKMLDGTGCALTTDFATAVYKTAWAALQK